MISDRRPGPGRRAAGTVLGVALGALMAPGIPTAGATAPAVGAPDPAIHLQLSPRVCTLTAGEKQCDARVHAEWQAAHEESLCLVILERPDVRRCWDHYAHGTYDIDLVFASDQVFQVNDLSTDHVLASEVLRVIREALQYRHKRREPWNLFE